MAATLRSLTVTLLLALAAPAALADGTAQPTQAQRDQEAKAAFDAALGAAKAGPAPIALIDQATLKLPAGYRFVPKSEAARLMRAMGNRTGEAFLGLVLPDRQVNWFVTLDYIKAGYVKDDDAKSWNADELLKSLREGTEAANADRIARGFPPIEVAGWIEPPAYAADTHRLVWAAEIRRKGQSTGGSVNYNTYALGREGYFELNLIGAGDVVVREKGRAKELLAALDYDPGKSYADYNPSTDKVAAYGLAALVAGVAAKKLGLLAVAVAFVAKFAKVFLLAGAALLAGLVKLLGGRRRES